MISQITVHILLFDQWLEELRRDPPPDRLVRRQIVRTAPYPAMSIERVSVVAGFVNAANQVVQLDMPCGEDWHLDRPMALDNANQIVAQIGAAAEELGLITAPGRIIVTGELL